MDPSTRLLAAPADLDAFRAAARQLLAKGVPPDGVQWVDDAGQGATASLWGASEPPAPAAAPAPAQPVPAAFLALCADVILHRDPRASRCCTACSGAWAASPPCGTIRWTPT